MPDTPAPALVPRSRSKRAEDAASLCVTCRLCCDGTLFGFVSVTPQEADQLRRRLPMFIDESTGDESFEQSCSELGPGGCGVYAERPRICSSYSCDLLRRVNSGELDCDDGLEIVDRIRVLVGRLDAVLPPGKSLWPRTEAFRTGGEPQDEDERRVFAAALLDLNVLDRILETEIDVRLGVTSEAPPPDAGP